MIEYFTRVLRFTDAEVWDVRCESTDYRVILTDENRPAEAADLRLPAGMSVESDELRDNLLTVSIYSNRPVQESHIESLDQFAKQLTDHVALAHCEVVTTFYTGDTEQALHQLVESHTSSTYEGLPIEQLRHLNQN